MLGISWDRIYLFPITPSISFKEILTGVDQVSARNTIIQKFFYGGRAEEWGRFHTWAWGSGEVSGR